MSSFWDLATCRATRGQLSPVDLAAIGARALECAAMDFSRSRSAAAQAVVHSADRLARHQTLCSVLQEGRVLSAQPNPVQSTYGHESFVLQLEHPNTGQRVRALFKPRMPGDASGWHRAPIEVVAYRLNLLLGFDYVPPAVYRTGGLGLHVEDSWLEFEEGAVLLWVEGAEPLGEVPSEPFLSDTRILDVLIHNSDRHRGHFLEGHHWVAPPHHAASKSVSLFCRLAIACPACLAAGCWRYDEMCPAHSFCPLPLPLGPASCSGAGPVAHSVPVLIDHAAGFRKEAYVIMDHENVSLHLPTLAASHPCGSH